MVVVLELLLSAILLLFAEPILMLFGATDTCYTYALAYYRIVAVGCVFQGISQVCCDFVRVSGKTGAGMCVTSIGAVTNIILDFLFCGCAGHGCGRRCAGDGCRSVPFCGVWLGPDLSGRTLVVIERQIFRIRKELAGKILSCGFAFFISQIAMGLISLVYNGQLENTAAIRRSVSTRLSPVS